MDIYATAPSGDNVSLKRLHADDAAEMLGIWMAPSGNNDKLISVLKHHALHWASKIRLGKPSQEEAFVALNTTISAKLKYPLNLLDQLHPFWNISLLVRQSQLLAMDPFPLRMMKALVHG